MERELKKKGMTKRLLQTENTMNFFILKEDEKKPFKKWKIRTYLNYLASLSLTASNNLSHVDCPSDIPEKTLFHNVCNKLITYFQKYNLHLA